MTSSNHIVANALASRKGRNPIAGNSAYSDFGLFKDYKTFAAMELSAFLARFNETGQTLKREAELSKRGTVKDAEHKYIDACLEKCLTAIKEARDRIQRQAKNVMQ